MAKKKGRRQCEEAQLDMTPMIDVVFQLIIFFVVTLKTADNVNPEIKLEYGKDGPVVKMDEYKLPPTVIEVKYYRTPSSFFRDKGRIISLNGARVTPEGLRTLLVNSTNRYGKNIPVLIRADKDTPHEYVREVMDICSRVGIWQVQFLAMVKPGKEE